MTKSMRREATEQERVAQRTSAETAAAKHDDAPRQRHDDTYTFDELQLAARNHAMPPEALRYPLTPVGLHYVLIHYDIPLVDVASWRLEINGQVERPLSLSLDDLRSRPEVSVPVTLECAGNGRALLTSHPLSQPWLTEAVGSAVWTGTPLAPILLEAGIAPNAVEALFTGLDHGIEGGEEQDYARSLTLGEALNEDVLLAYDMNEAPLPPQHGFPLRLIVPGWYGMTHVKWLHNITVLSEPYQGYQNARGYRMRTVADEPGDPVTRMLPRSLLEPPGMPEFMSRARFVDAGPLTLHGRAWSGWGPIVRVEVSVDGGDSWRDATLGDPLATYAWRAWSFPWEATTGVYDICTRATDATGRAQPMQATWNLGGYMNNSAQHTIVTVRERAPHSQSSR